MIQPELEQLIAPNMMDFMIPADNVANVIDSHTLSNGLLVLSQVNYSLIPVLSVKSKLIGLISMPMIIKSVMTVESIEMNRLDEMKVSDVMLHQPVRVTRDCHLEEVLHYLIDHNFICVVEDDDTFIGIITRKKVLQRLTYLLHETANPQAIAKLIALLQPKVPA